MKKKKIMAVIISLLMIITLIVPVIVSSNNQKDVSQETTEIGTETTTIKEEIKITNSSKEEIVTEPTKDEITLLYEKMSKEISEIPFNYSSEKREWFIAYKKIINSYPRAMFITIYDVFTKDEIELLFRVVQAEVGDYDFISKCNVASVIFNRHYYFQASISSVLFATNQFQTVTNGRYLEVEVDEDTILACEYVFLFGDTTNGAMFFDSTDGNSWAAYNKNFIFRDSAGHDFYR